MRLRHLFAVCVAAGLVFARVGRHQHAWREVDQLDWAGVWLHRYQCDRCARVRVTSEWIRLSADWYQYLRTEDGWSAQIEIHRKSR